MTANWTHGKRIGAGFAAIVALTLLMSALAISALRSVTASKDQVLAVEAESLTAVEHVRAATLRKIGAVRGYLLGGEAHFIEDCSQARLVFAQTMDGLRSALGGEEARRLLDEVERTEAEHQASAEKVMEVRRSGSQSQDLGEMFSQLSAPHAQALEQALDNLRAEQVTALAAAAAAATKDASHATLQLTIGALLTVLLATVIAIALARTTVRRIGEAVGRVQSSSSELQATANQQATGAKEQSAAMSEITTTMSELLATSQQIAESAQRVANIAEETSRSARTGEGTAAKSQDCLATIRRQVDVIVGHMVDLGGKSQEIGFVLDIVSELAEQTNILAINATIEAAGAGEAGKRFAVVADEIRKLADRVAGSTKEIRALIDEVRSAVNTSVMATESGSKAVDAGASQFLEVIAALNQIAALVATTTEAAREIELSTKQQTSAVGQVKVAISNVAQATTEAEVGSGQTLQTASQLASLSNDLQRFVRSKVAA